MSIGSIFRLLSLLFLGASLGSPAAADPPAEPSPCRIALENVAEASGIVFRHDRGAAGRKHLPETMGSGVAWLDYDGDGWLDLYAVQSGPWPPADGSDATAATDRLFRNRGDGTFAAAGVEAGRGYGQGVTVADVDGDGRPDLYLSNFGPDVLLLNRVADGRVRFEDVTAAAGLGLDGWSSSAAFADSDGDGWLDLYVTRYLVYDLEHDLFCGDAEAGVRKYCGPELFAGAGDRFFRHTGSVRGGGVHYEDRSTEAGLGAADGKGLGVVFTDLDGDRRPDVYVANDQTLNFFYANLGGTFEEVSLFSGLAVNRQGQTEAGMGIAVADVDADADPDLLVTNFDVETNTLYLNQGAQQFADASNTSGFGLPSFNLLGFGIVAADFDLDGALDVYVANGHVREDPRRDTVSYAQEDLVLMGDGTGRFVPAGCEARPGPARVGRGLAWADYDRDGDPDLALANSGGPLELLQNGTASRAWLGLLLVGRSPNTGAVGAEAVLETAGGRQARRVLAGDSYQSSSSPELLFGLGAVDAAAAVEITWPSGRRQRIVAPPAGRYLRLREPLP